MTPNDALRDGIRRVLSSHPALRKLDGDEVRKPDTQNVERYAYGASCGVGHETRGSTQQNLWVMRSSIDLSALHDIRHVCKPAYAKGERPGRNSNLEPIPGFRHAELICFLPKTIDEAKRVIAAVTGSMP